MSNEHTPGPWVAEDFGDDSFSILAIHGEESIPVAYTNDRIGHVEEEWANARLIAAAPELLEAAKGIEEAARNGWPLQEWPIDDLRAAIAKAEGG